LRAGDDVEDQNPPPKNLFDIHDVVGDDVEDQNPPLKKII
jgi:hypothetical protein